MYISDIMTAAPEDERGALEMKVYRELDRLGIRYERVDNDKVEAMEECVEISEKLGAEIRKTIVVCNRQKTEFYLVSAGLQEIRFKAICGDDAHGQGVVRVA